MQQIIMEYISPPTKRTTTSSRALDQQSQPVQNSQFGNESDSCGKRTPTTRSWTEILLVTKPSMRLEFFFTRQHSKPKTGVEKEMIGAMDSKRQNTYKAPLRAHCEKEDTTLTQSCQILKNQKKAYTSQII